MRKKMAGDLPTIIQHSYIQVKKLERSKAAPHRNDLLDLKAKENLPYHHYYRNGVI